MAKNVAKILRPSVLDRLMTPTMEQGGSSRSVSAADLKQSIRRDLESLLNTRQSLSFDEESFPEVSTSILCYGLPDLSGRSRSSTVDRRYIAGRITETIRNFEPRLDPTSIRVEILPTLGANDLRLHFGVHAVLRMEPIREPVVFDTLLHPGGEVQVTSAE